VLDALEAPAKDAPPPAPSANESAHAGGGLELDDGPSHAPAAEASPAGKPERRSESKPSPGVPVPPRPPVAAPATARDVVISAVTAVLGAALALALLVGSAQNEDGSTPWLGLFPAKGEVVATRVVSGLYDTSTGKPVFYVRGRIENRGTRVRGPVKIVAELTSDSGAPARAEAIAGAEPTPEDVWSVASSADADKLARTLEAADGDRHIAPGKSLPFFALIADPPADLSGHRLHVRVEPVEAWVPAAKQAQKP
jgi:hypothetical protein